MLALSHAPNELAYISGDAFAYIVHTLDIGVCLCNLPLCEFYAQENQR